MPQLRNISRQEYLKKREEQKLQALEDELADEEQLFACGPPSSPKPYALPCTGARTWHTLSGSTNFDLSSQRRAAAIAGSCARIA